MRFVFNLRAVFSNSLSEAGGVPAALVNNGSGTEWLDPAMKDVRAVSELLRPYDARRIRSYPVSARINHVANDDRKCSIEVQLVQDQNSLLS